jgi:RNA polymerase sigma factor (sigma-70 family)
VVTHAATPIHAVRPRLCPDGLTSREERELRVRLVAWSGRFLGLAWGEFPDCYQQAWESVMRGERQGRPVRNLEHALRWGISNAWRQECRRRRRRPADPLDDANDSRLADPTSSDPHERAEQLDAVRYLLQVVDGRAREVLLLRDIYGFTPSQVCERLGISERTLRRERAAALTALYDRHEQLLPDQAAHCQQPRSRRSEPIAA